MYKTVRLLQKLTAILFTFQARAESGPSLSFRIETPDQSLDEIIIKQDNKTETPPCFAIEHGRTCQIRIDLEELIKRLYNPFFGNPAAVIYSNINHNAVGYFVCCHVTYSCVITE
jgi:hypothetical protein